MDDKTITVYDQDGVSKTFDILFTYDDEEYGPYVFYYDASDGEEVYASHYDEEGHLFPVEKQEEWDKINIIFESYREREYDPQCDGCVCETDDCVIDCSTCEKGKE